MSVLSHIDLHRLPSHIGIIMDGNGRWAKKRRLPRTAGHKEGLSAAKRVVRAAAEIGIPYLTLYAFSTENWKRTQDEVNFLMTLIKMHLKKEYQFYRDNKVKVVHSGRIAELPDDIVKEIRSVMEDTKDFEGLTLNLAINYGGRDEIIRAVNRALDYERTSHKSPAPPITEKDVEKNLDFPESPEVDLIIRTGGEMRLSNFLLWEAAYAELFFDNTLWPDWDRNNLEKAIKTYQQRERRFGGNI